MYFTLGFPFKSSMQNLFYIYRMVLVLDGCLSRVAQPLLYEEIVIIIGDILSAWEKAECYEEVVDHSHRIFTLI